MVMRCVIRHARTPKFQLSGPTVRSLYCGCINMGGNWKNEKLCGNTTPAGRSVFTKFWRVFPISASVDITLYLYGKNVLYFFYNIARKNTKLLQWISDGKFSVFTWSYVNNQRSEFTNAML